MKKYYYSIFNLIMESEIELPEAIEISPTKEIDIFVTVGDLPECVNEEIREGQIDCITKEVTWFRLPGLVAYYIEAGKRIIVNRESNEISDLYIRSYLLGTACSIAIMQRDYLPIHGGVIKSGDGAFVIAGSSGSGKSTVVSGLLDKKLQLLSDDIAVIDCEGEKIIVLPSFPQQKLCRNAVMEKGLDPNQLVYIDEDRDKFSRDMRACFYNNKLPLKGIVILSAEEIEAVEVQVLSSSAKIKMLMNNIYRGSVLNRMGTSQEILLKLLKTSIKVPVYSVKWPKGKNTVEEVIEKIENKMLQMC